MELLKNLTAYFNQCWVFWPQTQMQQQFNNTDKKITKIHSKPKKIEIDIPIDKGTFFAALNLVENQLKEKGIALQVDK